MAEQGHTPGPWHVGLGREGTIWVQPPGGGHTMPVAECPETHGESYARIFNTREERLANAAFIVRACNCHDELLREHQDWSLLLGRLRLLMCQRDLRAFDEVADLVLALPHAQLDEQGKPYIPSAALSKAASAEAGRN